MAKFQKGQSGNPGGRPKLLGEVRDLAQQNTEEAIATLCVIMQDEKKPAAARVAAANAILDRGWGKPQQKIEADIGKSHEDCLRALK